MFKGLKKVKNLAILSLALFIFNFFILLDHHHFDDHHHDHESEQSCLVCHSANYASDNQLKNTLIKSEFLLKNENYFTITLTKHEIALHLHSRAPPLKNI
ncbi:MAG: hypothetical protein L7V30_04695 [Gammaproteobacteria bacterium]|nr:hypothetical protein [Gammaproteobacteria bacterium]